jgi:hypothetical protein
MCFPNQNQKSGLVGVFRIVDIAQDAATYAKDHGAVSVNERRKSRFIVLDDEATQQLRIPDTLETVRGRDLANEPKNRWGWVAGHSAARQRTLGLLC